ncbi:MAG: hypothetical protein ACRCT0_07425 [Plesiomonas shigelloides]
MLPPTYCISPTFHLKPANRPARDPGGSTDPPEQPPLLIEGEEAYQVHELLDSRCRVGHLEYLVDWEGYGPEKRSWVKAGDFLDPSLTADFHQTTSRQASSPVSWLTPASHASSHREPFAGGVF